MNRESLIVSRIRVGRMPGIQNPGFTIDGLVPGLNILYGPNGIGKSTTAVALRALLWPGSAPAVAQATATLRQGDAVTELDLAANKVTVSGSPLPALPAPETSDRYHLAFHQLIVSSERGFAAKVQTEMSGGYDIAKAGTELGYRRAQARPQKESAVQEKRAAYNEQVRLQEELLQNAGGLARLDADLARARQRSGDVALLNSAIAYHNARSERRDCVARARAFPLGARRIAGDELRRVDESMEAQAALRRQLADARKRRRDAQKSRNEAELPRGGIPAIALQEMSALVQEFRLARQALEHADNSFEVATTSEKQARDRIASDLTPDHLDALDIDGLAEIASLSERGDQLRNEWLALNELRKLLGSGEPPASAEAQRNAQFLLTQWLSAPTTSAPSPDVVPLVVVSLTGLVATFALALLGHPLWLLLLVPIVAALARGWRAAPTTAPDARHAIEVQYRALQVAPPAAWQASEVQERLNRLLTELAEQKVQEDQAKRWAPHADAFEACKHQIDAFDKQRQLLVEKYGFAPEFAPALGPRLFTWCAALVDWRKATAAVLQAETERGARARAAATKLDELAQRLTPYKHLSFATPAEAESVVADLRERQNHLAIAQDRLVESAASIHNTIENLRLEQREVAKIYREARLQTGARAALANCVASHREYVAAHQAMVAAKGATRHRRRELLQNRPEFLTFGVEVLKEQLAQASEAGEAALRLAEQRTQIRTRVEAAQKSTAVEEAYAQWRAALAALEDARDAEYGPVAGLCLTAYTQKQTREWDRPAVFCTADAIFGSITNGRYRLDFDGETTAFRAIDTASGLPLNLDQLSSGTRVQILIAVRLAFIESQEEGVRLPLVVDEVLANSDDERARAVVEALLALCRQGRQVFYLTAQADEVDKWSALLQDAADVPFKIVDMAAVRDRSAIQRIPSNAGAAPRPQVPAPNSDGLAAYALRLQAPRFDPQLDVGSTDLCDLCDSALTVYILRGRGLRNWGQTGHMLDRLAHEAIDAAEARRMAARAQVLERLIPAWRQGRPPLLEYHQVQASGAVTQAFDGAVRDLLREVKGSPTLFMDGLRARAVRGFQERQIEKLSTYLFANGLLDELPKLTPEQLLEQGAQAAREAIVEGVLTLHDVEHLVSLLPVD